MDRTVTERSGASLFIFLTAFAVVLMASKSLEAQSAPFYERLLERGKLEYEAGDFTGAAQTLEIAAFGLLSDLNAYEEAQIYRTLSEQGRGQLDEARSAIRSIFQAEAIRPVYPPAGLDPVVRAQFDAAVRLLLPDSTFPERPSQPVESEDERTVGETLSDIEQLTATLDENSARRAEALDRATTVLESIIELDPADADAHLLLARIAAERGDWTSARSHCAAAGAPGMASDDGGTLLVCQVSMGDTEKARTTLNQLDDGERQRPDVIRAIEQLSLEMDASN